MGYFVNWKKYQSQHQKFMKQLVEPKKEMDMDAGTVLSTDFFSWKRGIKRCP